jgi:hypothetical protein
MATPSQFYKEERDRIQFYQTKVTIEGDETASELLSLKKMRTLSSIQLTKMLDLEYNKLDFALDLTDDQQKIVSYEGSSFVLGRSGTGKVQCLTF